MSDQPALEERHERNFWVRAGALAALGIVIMGLLGVALLSISHAPTAHHVPVAYVGSTTGQEALAGEVGSSLDVLPYATRAAAVLAIRRLDVYGALIVQASGTELLKSTAASPQVASVLTALASTRGGKTATLTITELSPLPAADSSGGSLGVMLQVVVLVGIVGALGLGRLVPRYQANWTRGELPVLFLVLYALVVGVGTAAVSRGFGVGENPDFLKLAACLALINLAVTAAISALVSVIGSAGSVIGGLLFFLLGSPSSGAATALPLLPPAWRDVGQALPPGAGATLLRRVLYFPAASIGTQILTLGLYAGIGILVLGAVNLVAGARRRHSLVNLA